MASLYPIVTNSNAGAFLDAHGKKKIIQNPGDKKASRFLIDHHSFNVYVFTVLNYIHIKHPDAEKVDFMVERKEGVFEKLKQFYDGFANSLDYVGRPELKKYLGELQAVGKDRVPVQAADMLCWHASRDDLGVLKGRDAMRAATIFARSGKRIPMPDEVHFDLARAFAERMNESENGVPKVRRNHEKTNSGSPRQVKGRSGRGKASQKKKAKG
jgi:hypothetical protein